MLHISVGRMWSGLERLLEKRWFVGVRATTTISFVDIGREELAVFWINGSQREDSNKTIGAIVLCRGEYYNEYMDIFFW